MVIEFQFENKKFKKFGGSLGGTILDSALTFVKNNEKPKVRKATKEEENLFKKNIKIGEGFVEVNKN